MWATMRGNAGRVSVEVLPGAQLAYRMAVEVNARQRAAAVGLVPILDGQQCGATWAT
jgi:hypothetical protein